MWGPRMDFGELFKADADALYRFALRRLGNAEEAEDAVQDAFLRLCRRQDDLTGFDSSRAWMFRVMANICTDRKRAQGRRWRLFSSEPAEPERHADRATLSAEATTAQSEEVHGVMAALEQLPSVNAEALSLTAVEGMSYAEAAQVMGVPVGTIRSRVSRARQELKRLLDEGPRTRSQPRALDPGRVVSLSERREQGRKT